MQDKLLDTIDTIYKCIGDNFNHPRALAAFSEATDETGLYLAEIWPFFGQQKLIGYHNVPDQAAEAMLNSFSTLKSNSMMKNLPRIPLGVPVLRRAFVSDEEYFASDMYKITSEPWGLHSEGVTVLKKGLVSAVACGFMRLPGKSELEAEHLSLMAVINKHYLRAMDFQQRFDKLQQALMQANNVLDLVDFGMMLFGESKTPLFVNKSAERLLDVSDGLSLGKSGLSIHDREAKKQFNELFDAMNSNTVPSIARTGGLVRVNRPSRKRPYSLMLVPMGANKSGLEGASISVLLFDPSIKRTTAIKLFATSYGLTKAEARLALELAQGMSPEEFASEHSISINTVRTQLRALFAKTETSRQAELVSLLLRVTAGINLE
ncbi:MAG: helix-turn-helix transcriptional regulator [Hyphomicrobiales bacterium]